MVDLIATLARVVALQTPASDVALLLSGGVDSYSVGVACDVAGKTVNAYTYELEGVPSVDRPKAEALARRRGWPLKVVTVPTRHASNDFLRLVATWGRSRKVHAEVMFPMIYVLPAINEETILTGWNADDHYANTAADQREIARLRGAKASDAEVTRLFGEIRQRRYDKFDAEDSDDTFWIASRIASIHYKQLLDPYSHVEIRKFFAL